MKDSSILKALINTCKATTDLEGVYNDEDGSFYSWKEVETYVKCIQPVEDTTAKIFTVPPATKSVELPRLQSQHWYQVEVSYRSGNPIHNALMYARFLDKKGQPGAYNKIVSGSYDQDYEINQVHYLRVVKELGQLTS